MRLFQKSVFSCLILFCGVWALGAGSAARAQGQLPPIAQGVSDDACMLITEVQYTSVTNGGLDEWIELTNVCEFDVDIQDYKLGDEETRGQREGMVRFAQRTIVQPRQSITIAQSGSAFADRWGFRPNFDLEAADNTWQSVDFVGGDFRLANDGDEVILLDANNALVDAVSYGDSAVILSPPIAGVGRGESFARLPANCDSDRSADFQPLNKPTPGLATFAEACDSEPLPDAAQGSLPIGRLQGNGVTSPYVNEFVSFEGVVTGFHRDQNASGTIFYTVFVQDAVGREDGDPSTSDGMPVFVGRNRPDVQIGDLVEVSGQVVEYFGFTELSDDNVRMRVLSSNNVLPSPIEVDPLQTDFESLEGMRVRMDFAPAPVVGPTFDGCGFSVVRQDSGIGRIFRRTFDDSIQPIMPILNWTDVECPDFPKVKVGDEVSGLQGVLIYNFEQYKILVQDVSDLIVDESAFPLLPVLPAPNADQFSVSSFNVENLFDGIDDTGQDAEPKLSRSELETKLRKIAFSLSELQHCPTVVAIQEVENAPLLELLAEMLAPDCGFAYAVVHAESADGRGIDVAYLVEPSRVSVIGSELIQECTSINTNIDDPTAVCPTGEEPLFSRPPFVMATSIDGLPVTFVNNHFKSKRGGEIETGPRREAQAAHIRDWARSVSAETENLIVLGDFNDYENSKPLEILAEGGLSNALKRIPADERYSFVFSGASQLIDGIFVSPALDAKVAEVAILHTNADYPDALGTNLDAARIGFKSTDHDIPFMIVALDNAENEAPAAPAPTATPIPSVEVSTADDEGVPTVVWAGGLAVLLIAMAGYAVGRRR